MVYMWPPEWVVENERRRDYWFKVFSGLFIILMGVIVILISFGA